jgi:hypothetical protein
VFGRDHDLQKIHGRVVASKEWRHYGETPGFSIARWKYVVEYTLPDGETRRTELKQAMGLNSMKMRNPRVGAKVPLLLHPHSGQVEFDIEDPRLAIPPDPAKARRDSDKDAYKRALEGD